MRMRAYQKSALADLAVAIIVILALFALVAPMFGCASFREDPNSWRNPGVKVVGIRRGFEVTTVITDGDGMPRCEQESMGTVCTFPGQYLLGARWSQLDRTMADQFCRSALSTLPPAITGMTDPLRQNPFAAPVGGGRFMDNPVGECARSLFEMRHKEAATERPEGVQ